MTQDLDALPLPSFVKTSPERIHLVIGDNLEDGDEFNDLDEVTWCQDKQYDTDIEYVRADVVSEIVAAELRKAQEGREPVGEVVIRTYQAALGPVELATATLFTALPDGTKLYTSPPPKSDEARDAERWHMADLINRESNLHPDSRKHQVALSAYRDAFKSGLDFCAAIDAALAAQQKGSL